MLNNKDYYKIVPELSDNIHFNKLSENEYILSNVTSRHYLKINKDVYLLLQLIDGKKNIESISKESNFNIKNVYSLLYDNLVNYGILKGHDDKIKEYKKPSYLNLSFIIINEEKLSKFVQYFTFLFNRKISIPIVFVCLLLISFVFYFNLDIYKTFNLKNSLIYFFLVMTISVTFHEIGHASAANYFGVKHGGIGGGFYLFSPVYFADVTDIWRLPKLKRMIVNLAGIYFELIFCTLLSLVAILLNNYILLMTSIIVCFKTTLNLNPLFRSDGYWILSDLINKPNLFAHSFNKIKDLALYVFKGKRLAWKGIDILLLMYGVVSYIFITMFLYYVLIINPNSIIYFPKNLYLFIKGILVDNTYFSIVKYGELFVPLIFLMLLYNLSKALYVKYRQVKNKII